MKKTFIAVLLLSCLAAQPSSAQSSKLKEIFFGSSCAQTKQSTQDQVEAALIAKLQEADRKAQEEGELRAYQFNPRAVIRIKFEAASYVPVNYNREYAANCQGLLLDNQGTVLLNETCRKAIQHTKETLAFTVDFGNLIPGHFLKVSNYPRRTMLIKRNYMLAVLPLSESVKKDLPEIQTPVFVARKNPIIGTGQKYVLPRSLSSLFDDKTPQEERARFAESLPNRFTAQLQGFE